MNVANNAFVPDPKEIRRCRSCKARIFWARSERKGKDGKPKPMPIDVEPVADGNLSVHNEFDSELGRPVAHAAVVTALQAQGMREVGLPTYVAHFRACPHANEWRKRPP